MLNSIDKRFIVGCAASAALAGALGGFIPEWRYWLVLIASGLALGAVLMSLRLVAERLNLVQRSVEAVPSQITISLPSELHAMEVILRRFPECSIPTTSWSMRFSNLLAILDLLDAHRPRLVVEFGSGISTLLIAAWMRESHQGRIVSFDHDADWAAITRRYLHNHELGDFAEVVHAPLRSSSDEQSVSAWYDLDRHQIAELEDIDMVVVDGPPAGIVEKRLARMPALGRLYDRLAPSCVVILDDAKRTGESQIVNEWTTRYSEFIPVVLDTSTGVAILRRSNGEKSLTRTGCGK
jgi:predicted O-methyltransferase YrrM